MTDETPGTEEETGESLHMEPVADEDQEDDDEDETGSDNGSEEEDDEEELEERDDLAALPETSSIRQVALQYTRWCLPDLLLARRRLLQ